MIAIVDYGMGNLRSVQKGFERLGYNAEISRDIPASLAASGTGEVPPRCRSTNQTRIRAPAAVKPMSTSQFHTLPKVIA